MRKYLGKTILVTTFALIAQFINFIIQIIIAYLYGAQADMDAYFAANTLPLYVVSVLLSGIGFVVIPIFADLIVSGHKEEAWEVISSLINISLVILGVLTCVGMVFAGLLLRLTTPGLSPDSLNLAARVALITWPSIIANGIVPILIGVSQAQEKFNRPAIVPAIGVMVDLCLVILLKKLGVVGIAIAGTTSITLQAILLAPVLNDKRYRLVINWQHPAVRRIGNLLLPLILSGIIIRWTPILDRYLASQLQTGTISRLGYAINILAPLAMMISTGASTVIFPRMSMIAAEGNIVELKRFTALGLRLVWMMIIPVVTIGIVLAPAIVTILYQRGVFIKFDSQVVSSLLQIYLLALFGMCLGDIVSRTFYALKDTRSVSIVSAVAALLYAIYTPILTHYLGAAGVAFGYVIYYDVPLIILVYIIALKMKSKENLIQVQPMLKMVAAGFLGGLCAFIASNLILNIWIRVLISGTLGLIIYVISMVLFKLTELQILRHAIQETPNFNPQK